MPPKRSQFLFHFHSLLLFFFCLFSSAILSIDWMLKEEKAIFRLKKTATLFPVIDIEGFLRGQNPAFQSVESSIYNQKVNSNQMMTQTLEYNIEEVLNLHESSSLSSAEKNQKEIKLKNSVAKCPRWNSIDCELYIIFYIQNSIMKNGFEISFLDDRRPHKKLDKSFAQMRAKYLGKTGIPCSEPIRIIAKRAKSKFNTMKRRFFSNKKEKVPDFPLFLYCCAEKIFKSGKSYFPAVLKKAMNDWKENNQGRTFAFGPECKRASISYDQFFGISEGKEEVKHEDTQ